MFDQENFTPDFQRYLMAKRTVDDRALNRTVLTRLAAELPPAPQVLEIACGTGTMYARLCDWGLLDESAAYLGVDTDAASIAAAQDAGYPGRPAFNTANFFTFRPEVQADLLVASAFLDLVDLDSALIRMASFLRTSGLGYFPIHFDGLTIFEPAHPQDEPVLAAYHASMDRRPTGGHSRTGRRLFQAFSGAGLDILACGASDWIVHPIGGAYPGDEAYFLRYILHFFENSCAGAAGLADWLADRRQKIAAGELVFIAHQFDFLVQKTGESA